MTSKKRQKQQLQRRRRRIGRDANTATKNDEHQCDGETFNGNNPKASEGTGLVRNKAKSDGRNNIIAVHSLVGSVWLWASTWVRKIGSSTVLSTDSYFLPVIEPTATSATTIALVLLVSLVAGCHNSILQAIAINPNSTSICIVIRTGISVSVALPLLLWWIACNAARLGDAMVRRDGNEKSPSNNIPKASKIIDDEFATVRPLGLKRPLAAATDDETKDGFDRDEARSIPPTPQLATSEHVRTKLAEWLPFGLRYTTDLNLVFTTSVHGQSLQTLYQRLETTSSNHTIMLLEAFLPTPSGTGSSTHSRSIVGMYTSQRWHSSPRIYGDGRCFLFRVLLPDGRDGDTTDEQARKALRSECWKWTPLALPSSHCSSNNNYHSSHTDTDNVTSLWETFQRSNHHSLSLGIGASGMGAGLQLNHDLTLGESHRAVGFDNEPLVGDCNHGAKIGVVFEVGLVEVYQLVREIDGLPIK